MEAGTLLVARYPSKPKSDGELKFNSGEIIRFIETADDWSFGESLTSGLQGWFDAKLCVKTLEKIKGGPALERKAKKINVLADIIKTEKEFNDFQSIFIDTIVKQLLLRDTNFKRILLADPAIAVCITLIQDIHHACAIFLSELANAKTNRLIADSYKRFAPSIQLFAQFTSESSNALHSLKVQEKAVGKFLRECHNFSHSNSAIRAGLENISPEQLSFEYCFIQPLQHFKKYQINLESYVGLTDQSEEGFLDLVVALSHVILQTEEVDLRLKDEEANLKLLNIQNQFSGNVAIFKQGRRLVKEGFCERVKLQNNEVTMKSYYFHLFNDCILYSAKKSATLGAPFKLHKSIDLVGLSITSVSESTYGLKNVYSLVSKKDSEVLIEFHVEDDSDANEWFKALDSLLTVDNLSKPKRHRQSIAAVTSIPGVNPTSLGPRATCVYSFLQTEIPFADSLWQMYSVLIKPLFNATKGAALMVGSLSKDGETETEANHDDSSKRNLSKYQIQQVTDSLQTADVQVFLRAAEGLALSLQDFCGSIEAQCRLANWSEQIAVGAIFSSSSAHSLFNQYKSYASGQEATLRVLRGGAFTSFYSDAEGLLMGSRGKLTERIEFIRHRVDYYLKFMQELSLVTPTSHADYKAVQSALDRLVIEANEVSEVIRNRVNFEKLLDIQNSFINVNVFGPDLFVQKIASFDRVFIKEGDLKKVCRKKNKTFKFWLFNDYLIYGESIGNNSYSFHRNIDLSKCSVAEHNSDDLKNAFEIFGAEKSFVVIAPSQNLQQEWITAINKAIESVKPQGNPVAVAPLWTPDSAGDKCIICHQGFTFFKRRHHCRLCGSLVCGDHSSNKMILPFSNDKQKQRVCDDCFKTGNSESAKLRVSSIDVASQPNQNSKASTTDAAKPSSADQHSAVQRKKWPGSASIRSDSKINSTVNPFDDMPSTTPPPVPAREYNEPKEPPVKPKRLNAGLTAKFENPGKSNDVSPQRPTKSPARGIDRETDATTTNDKVAASSPQSSLKERMLAYQSNAQSKSPQLSPSTSPSTSPMRSSNFAKLSPTPAGDLKQVGTVGDASSTREINAGVPSSASQGKFSFAAKRTAQPPTPVASLAPTNASSKSTVDEKSQSQLNSTKPSVSPMRSKLNDSSTNITTEAKVVTSIVNNEKKSVSDQTNSVSMTSSKFSFAKKIAEPNVPQMQTNIKESASTTEESKTITMKNPFQSARRVSTVSTQAPSNPIAANPFADEDQTQSTPSEQKTSTHVTLPKRRFVPPPKKVDNIEETAAVSHKAYAGDIEPSDKQNSHSLTSNVVKRWNPQASTAKALEESSNVVVKPSVFSTTDDSLSSSHHTESIQGSVSPSKIVKLPQPPSPKAVVVSTPFPEANDSVQYSQCDNDPSTHKSSNIDSISDRDHSISPSTSSETKLQSSFPETKSPPVPPTPPPPRHDPISSLTPPALPPTPPRPPPLPATTSLPLQTSEISNPAVRTEGGEDGLEKYRKLKQLMPEAAVRQRMTIDGFSAESIDSFLMTGTTTQAQQVEKKVFESLPDKPSIIEDPKLAKYRILKESLPPEAVRQKMRIDGISENNIDTFLKGEIIEKLEITQQSSPTLALNLGSVTLKNAPPAIKAQRRVSILDEIQTGAKLKAVQKDDNRMKPASSAGGLLDNLAIEMFKRRVNMKQDSDSDDSDDSGFSDSDSDSD